MTQRHEGPMPAPTSPFGVPLDGPISGATAERIANQICDARLNKHALECHLVKKLEERLDEMDRKLDAHSDLLSEQRGASKAQARNVTIIVAVIGVLQVAAAVVALLVRLR